MFSDTCSPHDYSLLLTNVSQICSEKCQKHIPTLLILFRLIITVFSNLDVDKRKKKKKYVYKYESVKLSHGPVFNMSLWLFMCCSSEHRRAVLSLLRLRELHVQHSRLSVVWRQEVHLCSQQLHCGESPFERRDKMSHLACFHIQQAWFDGEVKSEVVPQFKNI